MSNGYGINVVDHGATPSAPGDDTAGIQAAINAAEALGGGVVFLPPGTYNVSQLQLKRRVVLLGEGWASKIVQKGGPNGHLIVLANTSVDQTVVRDLSLYGNKGQQTTINHGFYYFNQSGSFEIGNPRHLIQNVLINNFSGSGVVLHTGVSETRVENVTARLNDVHGFDFLTQGATDSWFVNCTAQASGRSGFHCSSWATRYIGCKSFGSGQAQIAGDRSGYLIDQPYQYFAACDAQENLEHGFHLENTENCVLSGCATISNANTGFLLSQTSAVVLEACNVAHIALPSGLQHVYGVDFRNGSTGNMVGATVTGVSSAVVPPSAQLGSNKVVINREFIGGLFNSWGAIGQPQEHFAFGKRDSPGPGNPYYVLQTGLDSPPEALLQGWDGATSRTFMKLKFASGVVIWGDPNTKPAVVTSEPATNPGTVVRRLPIYDGSGALLGYLPIYNAIS